MQPPYQINTKIVALIADISQKIGAVNAQFLIKQSPELRKRNRIKTIHASLSVEGNTLSLEQITAIIDNKKVLGPIKDIREVNNAIKVYALLQDLKPYQEKSFLKAHKILMEGLVDNAGMHRKNNVGILKGREITHLAPPANNVAFLMKNLFSYIKKSDDLMLLKSCVFHYEVEFIHPFTDGNGRMGRLWQTLLLMHTFPIFEYLPFETLISKNQKEYYNALSTSDKTGSSTPFIEFMLATLNDALSDLLLEKQTPITSIDRINLFLTNKPLQFSRKDYLKFFKNISTATASRDIKLATEQKLIDKSGDKNKTVYNVN